ncbi:MAG: amine dehydrogenase [Gammaproteobacteria bacterium]|nr:amine dehydrogenase [Gammaproteobacteria bacterium]MBV9622094.1 amine dehydrogenase [Gammaproteobacteria bacterium]
MSASPVWTAALASLLVAGSVAAAPPAPLPPEKLTSEPLPPVSPHWVYVYDEAFANELDGRLVLFDGDHYRRLGQIDAGFNPSFNLSPDGSTTAVATTYWSRGAHGKRTDVVELTDNRTLNLPQHEIVLPTKRATTLPTLFGIAYSSDAHFLYVAYVTPAASFGVLDPAHGTVLGEIDTAGCVLVIPHGPNHVSSLCESGRVLTVTLTPEGKESGRTLSEPFFNADTDPAFVQGIRQDHGYAFLTFLGEVHEVDFSGAQPVFAAPWSLVTPAEKGHWRPGASQVGALQRALHRLYVPMHEGGEGTHKDGGSEVWVFDSASHQRLARWPLQAALGSRILTLEVTQDPAPLLFVATVSGDLAVLDGLSGKIRHVTKHFAQTPWMMLTP